jgi:type I restriction enzyme S subunit
VIPWVSIKDLNNGLVRDTAEKVSQQAYDEFMHSKVVPAGTLLFSFKLTIGKLGILGVDAAHNEAIASLFPDQSVAIRDYLFYLFMAYDFDTFLDAYVKGSTLNKRKLQQLPIPLPPLPEQRRIAAVLNAIQDAIAAQEDVIAAARHFKRSLMQRLFTYGPGQEPSETKETEIGEIPVHWEVRSLGSVVDFTRKPKELDITEYESVPFIPMEMVPDTDIEISRFEVRTPADISSGVYCEPGDVLLAKITPSFENGKQGIVTGSIPGGFAYATTEVFPLKCIYGVSNRLFVFYLLKQDSVRQDLAAKMEGTTGRQRVPKPVVANYLLPIAPLHEQEEIADKLSTVDAKIAAEEDRKTALEALFKSMLHQLMTGQVRLLSDEGLPLLKN